MVEEAVMTQSQAEMAALSGVNLHLSSFLWKCMRNDSLLLIDRLACHWDQALLTYQSAGAIALLGLLWVAGNTSPDLIAEQFRSLLGAKKAKQIMKRVQWGNIGG